MARNPYAKPDRFSKQAKDEGYAARSVYKLKEIDQRFRLLAGGQRVLDLGNAPGSWSKYAIERVGRRGVVVGVDITPVALPHGTWITRSVFDVAPDELLAALGGPADVVLSDMAPLTTGDPLGDHVAQLELAARAAAIARAVLRPGGAFVTKVFDGEDAPAFVAGLRGDYAALKRVRPEAVRQVSREFFLVGTGFRS
jgi:23S rRNA (uridine2552-2'-O)-methyltransferase